MAITRIQAQKLCNAAEMELVNLSLGDALKALSAVQLRGKVKRTRTLRDKFADLFQRQTAATQAGTGTKRGNSGEANARTELKLRLFEEVLQRFETRAAQLEAQAQRAAAAAAKAQGKAAALAAAIAQRKAAPKAEPAAPKKSVARRAAAKAPKAAQPPAGALATTAAQKTVAPRAAKAAAKPLVKPAVAAPAKAPVKAPTKAPTQAARAQKGPAVSPRSTKAPAVKPATAVSKEVAVRGKNIGAHARSAQARSQAKRDKR